MEDTGFQKSREGINNLFDSYMRGDYKDKTF